MKVWDRAEIELATPGSAVRLASVARHITDCATRPGTGGGVILKNFLLLALVAILFNRAEKFKQL